MLRRLLVAAALATFCAGPVLAAEEKSAPKDVGQYVDLSPVALPIVVDGKLINYVFVSVRVVLTTAANTAKLREREPYFRDALVRAGHRTPFTNTKDYMSVDAPRLQATMMREAVAIAGPKDIKAITITSQAPKRRIAPPMAAGPRGAAEIRP
ncbi:MAG: hypothetical protein Q8Q88_12465 [Phenylobacterium sp.]|uniref:hypothetical protein n=1 Tax=Phenylobacterium sp. TaxID=1871053 RepID=UPI002734F10D|nr:hypothetical protein [Phenylobacterium sp.]MDP3747848.1 hypothetical protein [Phenylobacterium sp.]